MLYQPLAVSLSLSIPCDLLLVRETYGWSHGGKRWENVLYSRPVSFQWSAWGDPSSRVPKVLALELRNLLFSYQISAAWSSHFYARKITKLHDWSVEAGMWIVCLYFGTTSTTSWCFSTLLHLLTFIARSVSLNDCYCNESPWRSCSERNFFEYQHMRTGNGLSR